MLTFRQVLPDREPEPAQPETLQQSGQCDSITSISRHFVVIHAPNSNVPELGIYLKFAGWWRIASSSKGCGQGRIQVEILGQAKYHGS